MKKPTKIIAFLLSFLLIFEQSGFAQVAAQLDIAGHLSAMRSAMTVDKFRPLHLRYLQYDPAQNNFRLLIDKGTLKNPSTSDLENTSKDLLKYFFIGLSLPNDAFWVNLRPDSPDNIIDDNLAQTDIGRVLLEADLELKKDTAKATSPETPEGQQYWNKLYQKAEELFGSQNVTIPTLTRPWIVPDEIIIRETTDSAYIYKATLKVMLEQDYLKDDAVYNFKDDRLKALNEYSSQLIRETIIPKLTKEVNTAKKYAALRQVYYSLILSQWFKVKFAYQNTTYSRLIESRNITSFTAKIPFSKGTYFNAYQKSFKDGEYNFQTPVSTPFGQVIRSYFSGGFQAGVLAPAQLGTEVTTLGGGRSIRIAAREGVSLSGPNIGVNIQVDAQGDIVHVMAQGAADTVPQRDRVLSLKELEEKYDVKIEVLSQQEFAARARSLGISDPGRGFGHFNRVTGQATVYILEGNENDRELVIHEITEALGRQSEGVAEAGAETGFVGWLKGLFNRNKDVDRQDAGVEEADEEWEEDDDVEEAPNPPAINPIAGQNQNFAWNIPDNFIQIANQQIYNQPYGQIQFNMQDIYIGDFIKIPKEALRLMRQMAYQVKKAENSLQPFSDRAVRFILGIPIRIKLSLLRSILFIDRKLDNLLSQEKLRPYGVYLLRLIIGSLESSVRIATVVLAAEKSSDGSLTLRGELALYELGEIANIRNRVSLSGPYKGLLDKPMDSLRETLQLLISKLEEIKDNSDIANYRRARIVGIIGNIRLALSGRLSVKTHIEGDNKVDLQTDLTNVGICSVLIKVLRDAQGEGQAVNYLRASIAKELLGIQLTEKTVFTNLVERIQVAQTINSAMEALLDGLERTVGNDEYSNYTRANLVKALENIIGQVAWSDKTREEMELSRFRQPAYQIVLRTVDILIKLLQNTEDDTPYSNSLRASIASALVAISKVSSTSGVDYSYTRGLVLKLKETIPSLIQALSRIKGANYLQEEIKIEICNALAEILQYSPESIKDLAAFKGEAFYEYMREHVGTKLLILGAVIETLKVFNPDFAQGNEYTIEQAWNHIPKNCPFLRTELAKYLLGFETVLGKALFELFAQTTDPEKRKEFYEFFQEESSDIDKVLRKLAEWKIEYSAGFIREFLRKRDVSFMDVILDIQEEQEDKNLLSFLARHVLAILSIDFLFALMDRSAHLDSHERLIGAIRQLITSGKKYENVSEALALISHSYISVNKLPFQKQSFIKKASSLVDSYLSGKFGDKKFISELKQLYADCMSKALSSFVGYSSTKGFRKFLAEHTELSPYINNLVAVSLRIGKEYPDTVKKIKEALKALIRSNTLAEFNNWLYTQAQWNQETYARLIQAGYSPLLWQKGLSKIVPATTGTEEVSEKLRQQAFQLFEIAVTNKAEFVDFNADSLDSYEKAVEFAQKYLLNNPDVSEEDRRRVVNILQETEKLSIAYKAQSQQAKVTVEIAFDFFKDSYSGVGVPGCFNPTTGIHREMPLIHALETDALFLRVYKEGKMIANAVLILTENGVVVQPLYNSSGLNLDAVVFDALADLLLKGWIPAVLMAAGSAGSAAASGFMQEHYASSSKAEIVEDEYYFDSGNTGGFSTTHSLSRANVAEYKPIRDLVEATQEELAERAKKQQRKEIKTKARNALFNLATQYPSLDFRSVDFSPLLKDLDNILFEYTQDKVDQILGYLKLKNHSPPSQEQIRIIREVIIGLKAELQGEDNQAQIAAGQEGTDAVGKTVSVLGLKLANLEVFSAAGGTYQIDAASEIVIGDLRIAVRTASDAWFNQHGLIGNGVVVARKGRNGEVELTIVIRETVKGQAREEALAHEFLAALSVAGAFSTDRELGGVHNWIEGLTKAGAAVSVPALAKSQTTAIRAKIDSGETVVVAAQRRLENTKDELLDKIMHNRDFAKNILREKTTEDDPNVETKVVLLRKILDKISDSLNLESLKKLLLLAKLEVFRKLLLTIRILVEAGVNGLSRVINQLNLLSKNPEAQIETFMSHVQEVANAYQLMREGIRVDALNSTADREERDILTRQRDGSLVITEVKSGRGNQDAIDFFAWVGKQVDKHILKHYKISGTLSSIPGVRQDLIIFTINLPKGQDNIELRDQIIFFFKQEVRSHFPDGGGPEVQVKFMNTELQDGMITRESILGNIEAIKKASNGIDELVERQGLLKNHQGIPMETREDNNTEESGLVPDYAFEGNISRQDVEAIAEMADLTGARRIPLPRDIISDLEQKFGPGRVGPVEIVVVSQAFMNTKDYRPINGPVRLGNRIFVGDKYFARHNNDLRSIIAELGHEAMAEWIAERRPDLNKEAHQIAQEMEAIFRIERQSAVSSQAGAPVFQAAPAPQAATQGRMGGIDFRTLPIVTQSMGNLKDIMRTVPLGSIQRVNLTQEWSDIERLVNAGITPSAERIKDYLAASCFKGMLDGDAEKIISCISSILRMEEENCCSTDQTLRDILVVLELGGSGAELKAAFIN